MERGEKRRGMCKPNPQPSPQVADATPLLMCPCSLILFQYQSHNNRLHSALLFPVGFTSTLQTTGQFLLNAMRNGWQEYHIRSDGRRLATLFIVCSGIFCWCILLTWIFVVFLGQGRSIDLGSQSDGHVIGIAQDGPSSVPPCNPARCSPSPEVVELCGYVKCLGIVSVLYHYSHERQD